MRTLLLAAAVVLPWMLAFYSPAVAQVATPTPSAEQLELLRNLSPEQRDVIMRQITGGSSSSVEVSSVVVIDSGYGTKLSAA